MQDRVCFITGGASGIGEACVRRFVAAGYHVAFGDVQEHKGAQLALELGDRVVFHRLDVSVEVEFAAALDATVRRWGQLDCLVNNAAIGGVMGPIAAIPIDEYEYACNIIQRSVFIGLKHAARIMQPRQAGSIVNIASIAGLKGGYGPHIYNRAFASMRYAPAILKRRFTPVYAMSAGKRGSRRSARNWSMISRWTAWDCPKKLPRPCFGWRVMNQAM